MVLFFLRCPNVISIIGTTCLPLSDLVIKDPLVKNAEPPTISKGGVFFFFYDISIWTARDWNIFPAPFKGMK